jgi:hypothetical protein
VDPLARNFPSTSHFSFSENRIIDAFELEGRELVLVHGTFAKRKDRDKGSLIKADYKGGSTWKKSLGEGIGNALNWSKNQTYEYTWSGANKANNRKQAAQELAKSLMDPDKNPDADKKHVTLVGHSHGGNVNKETEKILIKNGWKVDIINIETPQRSDHQTTNYSANNGIYMNFFYTKDIVQYEGTGDFGFDPFKSSKVGGPRMDKNADINISVDHIFENSKDADWWMSSGGHSIHKDENVIKFIIEEVKRQVNIENNKSND